MKKIFIILLTVQTMQSAYCSGSSEISVGVSGGTSFMFAKKLNANYKEKFGGNTALGIHYGYNFTDNWALMLGMEAGYVETTVAGDNIRETRTEVPNYYRPVTLTYISNLKGFKERNQMVGMHASLMLRYQTSSIISNSDYYLAMGIKVGGGLWNTYNAHIKEMKLECDFAAFQQYFEDLPEHNLITIRDIIINKKSKTQLATPNIAFELETGLKYRLNVNSTMYLGVFINYGLNSVTAVKKIESTTKDMLVSFKPIENSEFTYAGFLNSNAVKSSSIARFHTGLKLCFTFSFKKYNTRMNPLQGQIR